MCSSTWQPLAMKHNKRRHWFLMRMAPSLVQVLSTPNNNAEIWHLIVSYDHVWWNVAISRKAERYHRYSSFFPACCQLQSWMLFHGVCAVCIIRCIEHRLVLFCFVGQYTVRVVRDNTHWKRWRVSAIGQWNRMVLSSTYRLVSENVINSIADITRKIHPI